MNRQNTEDFQGSENALYDVTIMNSMFVQIHRGTTPNVNPNKNYGLLMQMMCQRRFILGNKCTALVSDVDSGGGYVWGQRIYRKSLYLPLNIVVNLKLL